MNPDWFAVYTRSRHEKKVAGYLKDKHIEVFLPLRSVVNRWKDRQKEVELPLFSGYLFVRIHPQDRLTVLQTSGVVAFVCSENKPVPVPEDQIDAIRRLVESGLTFDPYPYVKEGMRVIIKRGPLKGVEGIVISKRKKHLLVLSVDLIQQSAALEISISDTDVK
jgi:transcription antitermination factor NusG